MERIIQEKISADHLLYVSLKYTKTTDVILNLIVRWRSLIEITIERLLEHAKKKKVIKSMPTHPRMKIDKLKEVYKKNKVILDAINLLEFLKRAETAEKVRECEFRKNVALKVLDKGEWVTIDLLKLKEYNKIVDDFINAVRQIL